MASKKEQQNSLEIVEGGAQAAPDKGSVSKGRIQQSDVPSMGATQAARLPRVIAEHFAYKPVKPLQLAKALNVQPNSGGFRMLCGASSAYGFTKGSWNSDEIALEPLGLSLVRPLVEGEEATALKKALLKPRVISEFLRRYHNAPLPREDIARNVLVDLKVPVDRAEEVYKLILQGAEAAGFIQVINGKKYVDLDSAASGTTAMASEGDGLPNEVDSGVGTVAAALPENQVETRLPETGLMNSGTDPAARRVFVTHGKNRTLIDLIKRFLTFAEMEPVVLVEQETVSQSVPAKVMEAMRSCRAAVIHVDAERKLTDLTNLEDPKETIVLNENVLIEIGAAMALYNTRFILLVKSGVTLPSNLQGLYQVRYEGDSLDGNAVMRLLEALSHLKKQPLPGK